MFSVSHDAAEEEVFVCLSQSGLIDLRHLTDITEAEKAISAASGQIVLSVTADSNDSQQLLNLAKRVLRVNTSGHRHTHLTVLLTGSLDVSLIDQLESFGIRVFSRDDKQGIETYLRVLVWRISKPPSLSGPCFYVQYSEMGRLRIFLLGRRKRAELLYGEKLGLLFEMLAVTHRWATTKQIAEELDISRSSVKVYFDRLREEYENKRADAGSDIPGDRVFCSKRSNSVWIHYLRGQVLILD
jgi:hypothetical protein